MKCDVVVIGAGLNGLIGSMCLMKVGLKVLGVEKDRRTGEIVETREYNDIKYSRFSFFLGLMPKRLKKSWGLRFR